jgi:SAM-dependent methyltransferase
MIGRWLAVAPGSRGYRMFVRLLGVPDFHTHLRLAPLLRSAADVRGGFCELGCGSGVNLIELLLRNREATAVGFEQDAGALEQALDLAKRLQLQGRLTLRQADLTSAIPDEISSADCVLLPDVLEHLSNAEHVAAAIVARLKPGARVLISVPTPLYPKIFGRAYHCAVGHVHDGYTLAAIDRLFAGMERLTYAYSTGPLSWPGVMVSYRLAARTPPHRRTVFSRAIAWTVAILATPFRLVDWWNGPGVSCSLFVAYGKPGRVATQRIPEAQP